MHRTRYIALAVAVMLVLSVATATAVETKITEWWNDTGRSAYGTTNDFWCDYDDPWSYTSPGSFHYQNGLFFNGDGFASIKLEDAGWAGTNSFGWFGGTIDGSGNYVPINTDNGDNRVGTKEMDLDGTDRTYGLYEIFEGEDAAISNWYSPSGDPNWDWQNPPDFWGFYFDTEVNNNMWFSVSALNSDGVAHAQVFDDPTGDMGKKWVVTWEDQAQTSSSVFDRDYGQGLGDTHATRPWSGKGTIGDIAHPTEPDYNDMILTFSRINFSDDPNMTPEPATWVLLAATGIFGVLRRRRKD